MIRFLVPRRLVILVLTAIALLALTVTGCRQKPADPPEKITIAYASIFNAVLVQIALMKGYFAQEGLEATPQRHAFGKPALQSVIEGKADIATVGDTPIVFAVMDSKKITVLAGIQTSNRNEAIVARRDRGITGPVDLQGKKIGLTLGTTGHFFADCFLLAHGIGIEHVKIIDLKPDEMDTALSTGKVDAVSTWNPTVSQLKKKLGNNGTIFFGESIHTGNFCVVASQEYVKKNSAAIKKVLRALIKAEAFVQQHPEESRRLVAEFLKVDKGLLDEIWDIFTFRVTLDQALLVNFENQSRWVIKDRLVDRRDMPNYLDFIYFDGLSAVKPEAVRIIR